MFESLMQQGLNFFSFLILAGSLTACSSLRGPSEKESLQANAYARVGQSHFNEKRYPESLVFFDQALAIDPENSSYIMSKGLVFLKMERLVDAEQWVSRACSRNPAPECWNNLSVVYANQKKFKESLAMADKALAVATYATPEFAYVNKSIALLGLKRNFEAKAVLKKALTNWPQDCALRIHLIRAQARDRAYEDALDLVTFTKKICRQSALPSLWEGYVYYKIGNSNKSRYSLERVLRFFPKTTYDEWARSALEKIEQKVPLEEPSVE